MVSEFRSAVSFFQFPTGSEMAVAERSCKPWHKASVQGGMCMVQERILNLVAYCIYPPVIKHGNGKYTIYRWFSYCNPNESSGFPSATIDYRKVQYQLSGSILLGGQLDTIDSSESSWSPQKFGARSTLEALWQMWFLRAMSTGIIDTHRYPWKRPKTDPPRICDLVQILRQKKTIIGRP